ncbi:hypothetical protein N9933_01075 [bacterium]|nr:hypothetical protein [bacterium]
MLYNSTSITREDYIFFEKEDILGKVSEESIFSLIFNEVSFCTYYRSPFREDKSAGCYFSFDSGDKLRFYDHAYNKYYRGTIKYSFDCFDAVQIYFNISNFQDCLRFIFNNLIKDRDLKKVEKRNKLTTPKKVVSFLVDPRPFNTLDQEYWEPYGISSYDLQEDKVFPVNQFRILNSSKGDILARPSDICYAFTDFFNHKKKIYRPLNDKFRFLTNCGKNDIGGLSPLIRGGTLVIKKSYKDYRVIKNQGYKSVWMQNEGMIPDESILIPLCKDFESVPIFYDNDPAGIKAAGIMVDTINKHLPNKAYPIHLPTRLGNEGITDPSDYIKSKGKKELNRFLIENICNTQC